MAGRGPQRGRGVLETARLDSHIRRENPQKYYDIVELIGSGSYGQVYTVSGEIVVFQTNR